MIVTFWLQGTSWDGDPQDHIHNQIARITRTVSDGRWLAHDTASLRAVIGALQAVAATAVECELTREFGVDWVPRADGRGTRTRAGMGAQERPRAELTRAVLHHAEGNPAIPRGQGRGTDRLGRALATVGRHDRRRASAHRPGRVERMRPGRERAAGRCCSASPMRPCRLGARDLSGATVMHRAHISRSRVQAYPGARQGEAWRAG